MAKHTLYLFVGYPGAGKTTTSRIIADRTGAVNIWTDYERKKMFGEPTYSQAENDKLYEYLDDLTDKLLQEKESVIFDTNFNYHKDRRRLCQLAQSRGADCQIIWMTTPKEIAKQRALDETDSDTRVFGSMSETDFERIASHLEPPTEDEKVIKIDGSKFDRDQIVRILNL